ncbi:glycosyl transferase, group 1 family protein [Synechococcus sp. PCC 7335]|uniref:glycosyltransferase family 4 protein n=1 Tax=Synechococcus sp. (strain ATCC 29403 / PCC 7335) TaxID=91464 RepID=UPI00017EC3DA|nr:glycosyltransferase family 4 protein [Synechococcus sp. PCC 7335]EDX87191.1 glycosyl transferase, group 1 family protein [Synechococcus sp. PCC 7335]
MPKPSLKSIYVVSHHWAAGGKPLDSLWFSQAACLQHGLQLKFVWNGKANSLRKLLPARWVVFDSIGALAFWYGPKLHALAKFSGKKIAVYWHETEWEIEAGIAKCSRRYPSVRYALKDPHVRHFHVCQAGLDTLAKQYAVKPDNLYLLPNISDSSRLLRYSLPLPSEPYLYVACGRVKARKGPDLFLEIAKQTLAYNPKAKFVWIGSFERSGQFSEAAIAASIRDQGLEHAVTFTGEQQDPTPILAKASAFLLTSRDDPLPKVLMEALALGKSCIAFDVGGVADLLGQLGVSIPPGDVSAFVQALRRHQQAPPISADEQNRRRQWYLQRYTPEAFGHRFAKAVDWWNHKVPS